VRVDILDRDVLVSVPPAALRAFAVAEGWRATEKFGTTSEVYLKESGELSTEIILPVVQEIADYATVVARLVHIFARELGRDELAIFKDLTQADRDVIRIRATEANDDGSIPLDSGVDLVSNARNLLSSAACAATEPRKTYHLGKMQKANKYMDRIKLGQTEIGSFVVTLLAPVPLALDGTVGQMSLLPELAEEPYERQVTRVLANALDATKRALAEANRGLGRRGFDSAVSLGVSANLCEAIAAICNNGDGAEISLSWAKTRPTPLQSKSTWFSNDESEVLKEVAREFRLKEPRPDSILLGYIPNLQRAEEQTSGTVKLVTMVDGQSTSVSADLQKEDYERAVEAHGRQLGVSVTGDLVREGQRWKLTHARDVSIVSSGSGETP
jgi:hypothetical protein